MSNTELRMPYDIFVNNILEFMKLSDKLNDLWHLVENMGEDYKLYITKKIIKDFNIAPESDFNTEQPPSELLEKFDKSFVIFEYHITYNLSYGVPLLCVNVWNMDGKRLSVAEAWKFFNKHYAQDNMHSVLTQQDHPVLQTPILVLHPCKTIEILEYFIGKSKNPVVSWLSSIGPAVHLNLNNEYEKLTRNEE